MKHSETKWIRLRVLCLCNWLVWVACNVYSVAHLQLLRILASISAMSSDHLFHINAALMGKSATIPRISGGDVCGGEGLMYHLLKKWHFVYRQIKILYDVIYLFFIQLGLKEPVDEAH